jgi:hypothetical protein
MIAHVFDTRVRCAVAIDRSLQRRVARKFHDGAPLLALAFRRLSSSAFSKAASPLTALSLASSCLRKPSTTCDKEEGSGKNLL